MSLRQRMDPERRHSRGCTFGDKLLLGHGRVATKLNHARHGYGCGAGLGQGRIAGGGRDGGRMVVGLWLWRDGGLCMGMGMGMDWIMLLGMRLLLGLHRVYRPGIPPWHAHTHIRSDIHSSTHTHTHLNGGWRWLPVVRVNMRWSGYGYGLRMFWHQLRWKDLFGHGRLHRLGY